MSQRNLQSNKYFAALKQKQEGTLPRFEEELWRHCCYYYHSNVPTCDLCKPRSDEERMAIKKEICEMYQEQNIKNEQNTRKRKIDSKPHELHDLDSAKSAKRVAAYRKSLSPEASDNIKQKDKYRHKLQRQSLTSQAREKIKQKNKELQRLKRGSLAPEAKEKIKQKNKEQHAAKRKKDRKVLKATTKLIDENWNENDIEPYSVGTMTYICSACHSLMFAKELHRGSVYSLCCGYGKIKVPDIKPPPPILQELLTGEDDSSKDFRAHIRCYNSALALSSIGVELGETFKFDTRGPWTYKISGQVYHSLGTIFPKTNSSPVFSQLYVYDREHELTNRQKRNPDNMDEKTLKKLQDMMHENNPYVKEYIKAADMVNETPSQHIQLVLKATGTPDPRRFNIPRGNDIAIVIPQISTDKPTYRDVVLYKTAEDHPRGHTTIRIHEMHPMYDPTAYPLLFIFGDKGYDYETYKPDSSNSATQDKDQPSKAVKVTTRKFYRYRFMERDGLFNILHHSGRLFQQYMTDMWCKIEKEQLDYHRRRQNDLRTEAVQGLMDAMATNPTATDNIGSKIILPSEFTDSPRQMHQLYQDSMAMVRHFGKPELFITFTCNPKWPAITEASGPRPDS